MSQISAGNVTVTNGSATVTKNAGGPSWSTVTRGCYFGVQSDAVIYPIASFIPAAGANPDTIMLQAPYQGSSSAIAAYIIVQDVTPGLKLPLINTGDLMTGAIYNESARILDYLGVNVGGSGNMLRTVYDANGDNVVDGVDGPVILGASSIDVGEFPNAIAVPRYANHPDAIWNYGPLDDHFDGTTLNPKWAVSNVGGVLTVGNSQVQLASTSAIPQSLFIQQSLPVAASCTITWKWRIFGMAFVGGSNAQFFAGAFVNLAGYSGPTLTSLLQLQIQLVGDNVFNTVRNMPLMFVAYGPTATEVDPAMMLGDIPPYWRFVCNPAIAIFLASFDGINFFPVISGVSPSQSNFATLLPNFFQIGTNPSAEGTTVMAIDWFKYTSP